MDRRGSATPVPNLALTSEIFLLFMETREIYFFRHFRDSNDLVEFCNTFVLKFVKSLSCSRKDSSSRKERTRRI